MWFQQSCKAAVNLMYIFWTPFPRNNSGWLPLVLYSGIQKVLRGEAATSRAKNCLLTLSTPNLQNGQTHSKICREIADKLFECVWPFCGIGAYRVKMFIKRKTREGKAYAYRMFYLFKSNNEITRPTCEQYVTDVVLESLLLILSMSLTIF